MFDSTTVLPELSSSLTWILAIVLTNLLPFALNFHNLFSTVPRVITENILEYVTLLFKTFQWSLMSLTEKTKLLEQAVGPFMI